MIETIKIRKVKGVTFRRAPLGGSRDIVAYWKGGIVGGDVDEADDGTFGFAGGFFNSFEAAAEAAIAHQRARYQTAKTLVEEYETACDAALRCAADELRKLAGAGEGAE